MRNDHVGILGSRHVRCLPCTDLLHVEDIWTRCMGISVPDCVRARLELWPRKQLARLNAHDLCVAAGAASTYNIKMPWNQALMDLLEDRDWWHYEFKGPALMYKTHLLSSQRKSCVNASSYLVVSSIRSCAVAMRRPPVTSQGTRKFWKEPSSLKQHASSKVVARLGSGSSVNSPCRIMRYG